MEGPVINKMVPILEPFEIPPSLLSSFLSFQVTETFIFFKWGALFLALVASFTALIKKIRLFFLSKYPPHPSSQPLLRQLTEGEGFSSSCSGSDSESEADEENEKYYYHRGLGGPEENFIVKGNSKDRWQFGNFTFPVRRKVSVLDLSSLITAPVVAMWDNDSERRLGLALDVNRSVNNDLSSLFSSNVVVSAERDLSGRFLRVWDRRVGRCGSRLGKSTEVVKVSETGGVLVRDDFTGTLTLGDVRKVGTPLLDADVDTWWDADAVIVGSEEGVEL